MTIYAEGVCQVSGSFCGCASLASRPTGRIERLAANHGLAGTARADATAAMRGMVSATFRAGSSHSRASPTRRGFVITGTQTGGVIDAQPEHYVTVKECYPARNLVVAEGPVRPSSESMTHGAIYAQDSRIRWVMHGHSPHIWRNAAALSIPITDATVPYGTPEMSAEVARLFRATDVRRQRVFSMGGHDDGVVSFGRTAEEAGAALLNSLAKSLIVYRPLG
jgi:ribulose-5-phosphate 4-epimerase/fuculose-1-phosphate aldolase